MNKYGEAAIMAANFLNNNKTTSPQNAWEMATITFYPKGSPAQIKGCPKCTFLGLCEEGYVLGIKKGTYLRKHNCVNKGYAIHALKILKAEPTGEFTPIELWEKVVEGKRHNNQMDVVLALRTKKLLNV